MISEMAEVGARGGVQLSATKAVPAHATKASVSIVVIAIAPSRWHQSGAGLAGTV